MKNNLTLLITGFLIFCRFTNYGINGIINIPVIIGLMLSFIISLNIFL